MKRDLLAITMLCMALTSYAQIEIAPGSETIYFDEEVCTYHPAPVSQNVTVQRSALLEQRMVNDTPCSSFIVNYNGFTSQAETAFQFAVTIWEHSIASDIPIRVQANFGPLGPGVLGGASPNGFLQLTGPGIPANTLYPRALAESVLGTETTVGGQPSIDISATFSSTANFYFGLDANPPAGQIDFVSVVLHELGHGLGIVGFGRTTNGGTEGAIRNSGFVSIWDQFITGTSNLPIITFPDPSSALLFQLTSNNLFCNSPEATAQNSGTNPRIFAPTVFNQGSSYSHWDENTFLPGDPNSLMTPTIAPGEAIHDPGLITLGFMQDMGWSICGSLLSVEDVALDDISISPNPFNSTITIRLPNAFGTDYDLSIIDVNGRIVFNSIAERIGNEIELSNLGNLKDAVYFLQINDLSSGASITKKIVKL